jgi:DNA-directed RNA polymerase omega subunit
MTIKLSRGPNINVETCVEAAGGRYNLVLIAAARAREIRKQNPDSQDREHLFSVVTALEEIQAGKVDADYIYRVKNQ